MKFKQKSFETRRNTVRCIDKNTILVYIVNKIIVLNILYKG